MAKIVDGKDVLLYIYNDTNTAYEPVACLTDHEYSVDVETETPEVTKCDPDPMPEAGAVTYEITGNGQMLASDDADFATKTTGSDLEGFIWDKEEVQWKIAGGNEEKYGTGLLSSYSETAPAEGKMTFSFTLTGNEKPADTDPNA